MTTDTSSTKAGLRAGLVDVGQAITQARALLAQQMHAARTAARTAHTAGIPIATIAHDLGVTRPTVYTWISPVYPA